MGIGRPAAAAVDRIASPTEGPLYFDANGDGHNKLTLPAAIRQARYENNWDNAQNEEQKHPLKGIFRLNDIDPATVPRKDAGTNFFVLFLKVTHIHTHTHTLIPPVYFLYQVTKSLYTSYRFMHTDFRDFWLQAPRPLNLRASMSKEQGVTVKGHGVNVSRTQSLPLGSLCRETICRLSPGFSPGFSPGISAVSQWYLGPRLSRSFFWGITYNEDHCS